MSALADHVAVSRNWGPFCRCPNSSPVFVGLYWGALIFGNCHVVGGPCAISAYVVRLSGQAERRELHSNFVQEPSVLLNLRDPDSTHGEASGFMLGFLLI